MKRQMLMKEYKIGKSKGKHPDLFIGKVIGWQTDAYRCSKSNFVHLTFYGGVIDVCIAYNTFQNKIIPELRKVANYLKGQQENNDGLIYCVKDKDNFTLSMQLTPKVQEYINIVLPNTWTNDLIKDIDLLCQYMKKEL